MACEATLKHTFTSKEMADKKLKERKKNLLLLIQQFLKTEGYIDTYYQLINESKAPKDYEICDNIELNNILQEYETYYYIRFQKYPSISKKVVKSCETETKRCVAKPKKKTSSKESIIDDNEDKSTFSSSSMVVLPVFPRYHQINEQGDVYEEKLFRPLGSFDGYSDEWKGFADIIVKEIVEKNLNVKWNDIVGLDSAKDLLKEAIVYPMKYPGLYRGIITPWKGLLLYGPSGTGKTLLAKAVATECKTTFFNISASSIISKWRGDSEKLVRVMFDLARLQAPSTIFVDELDAIASKRGSSHEHEASRRLKSELLVQLDGLCQSNENIFILTTSNLPWDLDTAVLRRLEKKIFVDLPDLNARKKLLEMYLPLTIIKEPLLKADVNYLVLAEKCEGYSGSDIKLLCKEVAMSSMRGVFKDLEESTGLKTKPSKLACIKDSYFHQGLLKVKASTAGTLDKYISWGNEFGTS